MQEKCKLSSNEEEINDIQTYDCILGLYSMAIA